MGFLTVGLGSFEILSDVHCEDCKALMFYEGGFVFT